MSMEGTQWPVYQFYAYMYTHAQSLKKTYAFYYLEPLKELAIVYRTRILSQWLLITPVLDMPGVSPKPAASHL